MRATFLCDAFLWLLFYSGITQAALSFKSPNGTSVVDYARSFPVSWDRDANSNPITIWLYSGYDAGISQIDTIVSNTVNDGEYSWIVSSPRGTLPSGCQYAMLITDGVSRVWSSYFSINAVRDGGLPANTNCTSLATNPVSPALAASAAPTTTNTRTVTSTGSATRTASTTSSTSRAASGANNPSSTTGTGITARTLAIAIAIPIVALLLFFGSVLCCLRIRGYLRKRDIAAARPEIKKHEPPSASANDHSGLEVDHAARHNAYSEPVSYGTRIDEDQIHMIDGRPLVAELHGNNDIEK